MGLFVGNYWMLFCSLLVPSSTLSKPKKYFNIKIVKEKKWNEGSKMSEIALRSMFGTTRFVYQMFPDSVSKKDIKKNSYFGVAKFAS